jgi:hypothetical protein
LIRRAALIASRFRASHELFHLALQDQAPRLETVAVLAIRREGFSGLDLPTACAAFQGAALSLDRRTDRPKVGLSAKTFRS